MHEMRPGPAHIQRKGHRQERRRSNIKATERTRGERGTRDQNQSSVHSPGSGESPGVLKDRGRGW